MTTYDVSIQQMDFVNGEMQNITKQITQTLSNLDDAAKQNLSQWNGDAQAAYYTAKAKWDAAAAVMVQDAATAVQALGTIGESYTSGEKYGVNLWNE